MGFQHIELLPEGGWPLRQQLPGKGGKREAPRVVRRERGLLHHGCLAHSPQVNLLVPAAYLVFWAFLLVFSFISEPMVCGVGVIIILTGVPIFFLGVFWRSKPKCVHRLTGEWGSLLQVLGLEMGPSWGLAFGQGLTATRVLTTKCLPTTWLKCPGPTTEAAAP